MKTIPSLVASSTIGAAAAGLVFGKPDSSPTPQHSASTRHKLGDLQDVIVHNQGSTSSISRPATSSIIVTPGNKAFPSSIDPSKQSSSRARPSSTRLESPNYITGRTLSSTRHNDSILLREAGGEDTRRESVSSRGSWIRRLSTVPNSNNNSPRSSTYLDSSSIVVSQSSAAPILPKTSNTPVQPTPNKLVKRNQSDRAVSGPESLISTKPQFPTLRRPATSHQRSVTLKQKFTDDSAFSKDLAVSHIESQFVYTTPTRTFTTPEGRHAWRQYFESRPTKISKERLSGRLMEGAIEDSRRTSRRVIPDDDFSPTLVKPAMITKLANDGEVFDDEEHLDLNDSEDEELERTAETMAHLSETLEVTKRPRRSLSMQFSTPGSWIGRTSSLRGTKTNLRIKNVEGKRHASNPISGSARRRTTTVRSSSEVRLPIAYDLAGHETETSTSPAGSSSTDPFAESFQARTRNASSPLPPLSRLSSFNVDLARLGLSSSSPSRLKHTPASPALQTTAATSTQSAGSPTAHSAATSPKNLYATDGMDRASTLVGSDHGMRGLASGEEDENDFRSETVFDSLRSGATGSLRSHNAPLDSMFDESPPSIDGSFRTKKLLISESSYSRDACGGNDLIEEDEGMLTPMKELGARGDELHDATPLSRREHEDVFPSSPPSFSLATRDFGSLSLDDDDDDDDWAKDEDSFEIGNQLSPPSNYSGARRVSPVSRNVLLQSEEVGPSSGSTAQVQRAKSNLFDWSESIPIEKADSLGNSPRPRTAHAKKTVDGRGSRATGRRGPSALHIRSQSVPVVPDVAGQREHSKLTTKFGTWGLGAKPVSEDWDGDFDFEGPDVEIAEDGESKMENSGMLVPEAIQASQANVVGHVGQIREVCLLVEDLKRLRTLAKEKDLLNGSAAMLWIEAEGIIALAAPEDEDVAPEPIGSPTSIGSSGTRQARQSEDSAPSDAQTSSEDNNTDDSVDAGTLSRNDAPFEVLDRHRRPNGVVYAGGTVRRRSVFSPDDNIFGMSVDESTSDQPTTSSHSVRHTGVTGSQDVARSVMENMHQHRSTSDPVLQKMATQTPNKLPFDTTSLRDLVQRASLLARTLAEVVRRADGHLRTPETSPHRDASPAFTRVFTDPGTTPPKSLPRSQSKSSVLGGSIDASPTRSLSQRMHMMTVV